MYKTAAMSEKQDVMDLLLNAGLAEGSIKHRNLSDFSAYFKLCQPQKCQVLIRGKRSVGEIVTAIAGYLGGLNAILSFFCGILLMKVLSKNSKQEQEPPVSPTGANNCQLEQRTKTLEDSLQTQLMALATSDIAAQQLSAKLDAELAATAEVSSC